MFSGAFSFFDMMDDYDDRKIARHEKDDLLVSTAEVTDSGQPYETAVSHPKYNDDKIIIVEMYDTKAEAKRGHKRWVGKMTAKRLPKELRDVSTSGISQLCDVFHSDEDWRKREKIKPKKKKG